MRYLLRFADGTSRAFGEVCYYLLLVLLVLVFGGAMSRYLFNAPLKWVPETSQFIFGASFMLAGGFTLLLKGHSRVDVLFMFLSPKAQAILELFTSAFFWLFSGMLLYKGAVMAWDAVSVWETAGTYWNPPVWPIKMVIPLSALLLMLQGVAKFIRDWHLATTGRDLE